MNSGIKTGNTSEKIKEIYSLHGINSFIIDSNWNVLLATGNDKESFKWLQRFIFGKDIEIIEIEEKSEYSIVRGHDTITGFSYLVMHGVLYDGTQIVLQITLDSIKENVKISNRFIKITGASVALISIIFVFIFSSKFTRPMKELSQIAEEMSNMNFNVKYRGNSYDEIGRLGQSINSMSDSLKENIARLKEANLDLKKDIEQKEEIARRQREFLGNVSHELKTPIALIEGYAEGLKEGVATDDESRDFYCEVIVDEALKMDKLVRNLLSLDNVESGKMTTGIERFDLGELIGEIVRSNHK